jgi:hypothetical protein
MLTSRRGSSLSAYFAYSAVLSPCLGAFVVTIRACGEGAVRVYLGQNCGFVRGSASVQKVELMTSSSPILRTAIIYAVILPLALYVGYLLADGGIVNKLFVGLIIFGLMLPLLLRWHHLMLFLVWNMTAMMAFLPGAPQLWLLMAVISLCITVLERTLAKDKRLRFISVPSLTLPILFLLLVVLFTAKETGFSLRVLGGVTGGQAIGGKGYVWIVGAALGFFAMTSREIPREKAGLYAALFFLAPLTNAVGSTFSFAPPQLYYLYYVFPVDSMGGIPSLYQQTIDRFYGVTLAALFAYLYLLARHGVRGMLEWRRPGRIGLLFLTVVTVSLGGYRSFLILLVIVFLVQFYFEGLLRTQYAITLGCLLVLVFAFLVPFADELPMGIQRTLSFLPLDVNPVARYDAEKSTEWRVEMWKTAWPDVKKHLWNGKGLQLSGVDLDLTDDMVRRGLLSSQEEAMLTGNYHNGPLTVLIPFGVWGMAGWLWFLAASTRALHRNYRYGDQSLKMLNTFLLALFLAKAILFFLVFGDFRSGLASFLGIVGLSVALNHGIRGPVRAPKPNVQPFRAQPRLALAPEPAAVRQDELVEA